MSDMFRKTFNQGDVIFKEGDLSDCAYLVEEGAVEVSVKRKGKRVALATLDAGELFGEIALLDGGPRTATVTAIEPATLVCITEEQLRARLEKAEPLIAMLLEVLLGRLRRTHEMWGAGLQPQTSETSGPAYRELKKLAQESLLSENRLRRALEEEEFELHYQPIVNLCDSLPGTTPAGFEALLRWRNKDGVLIPPLEFIETSEQNGLIVPIGYWLTRRAATDYVKLRKLTGNDALFMSINVSPRQFAEENLIARLTEQVELGGAKPENIKLEITESALIGNPERAVAILEQARMEGFRLALDDFGTGYSSLSYLHQFPVDTIKIDRTFTRNLMEDENSLRIVHTIANLAKTMELEMIAEGIENEAEMDVIRSVGCPYGQGYLFAPPLMLADVAVWLKERS